MGSSPDECPLNAANSGEIWGTGEGTITSWVRRDIGQQGSDNSSVSQWPPKLTWSGLDEWYLSWTPVWRCLKVCLFPECPPCPPFIPPRLPFSQIHKQLQLSQVACTLPSTCKHMQLHAKLNNCTYSPVNSKNSCVPHYIVSRGMWKWRLVFANSFWSVYPQRFCNRCNGTLNFNTIRDVAAVLRFV